MVAIRPPTRNPPERASVRHRHLPPNTRSVYNEVESTVNQRTRRDSRHRPRHGGDREGISRRRQRMRFDGQRCWVTATRLKAVEQGHCISS